MSIAIVSETRFVGGNNAVSARVSNYARSLNLAGQRVLLLSLGDYYYGGALTEIEKGILSYGTGNPGRSKKNFLCELTKLTTSERIEAILFYPTPNPSFELRFLRWKHRISFENVYCEINEVRRFEQTFVKTFSLPKRIVYHLITVNAERLTHYYKGLVCISKNIKDYFYAYNTNSIVIPILSDFPIDKHFNSIRESTVIRFVFTGTVAIEKENLVELLRGFYAFNKEYDNWEFLMYGRVPKQNQLRLLSIIEILGLVDKVKLMGEIDHSCVPKILSSADCLILPRKNTKQNYYGFSTKLSEYAVSGTPIILTDTGVVFDYFQDGRDCLRVEGYEAQGFYEQLKRFVSLSAEEKSLLAYNAYSTAKTCFDWHIYSDQLYQFLHGSIDQNNP